MKKLMFNMAVSMEMSDEYNTIHYTDTNLTFDEVLLVLDNIARYKECSADFIGITITSTDSDYQIHLYRDQVPNAAGELYVEDHISYNPMIIYDLRARFTLDMRIQSMLFNRANKIHLMFDLNIVDKFVQQFNIKALPPPFIQGSRKINLDRIRLLDKSKELFNLFCAQNNIINNRAKAELAAYLRRHCDFNLGDDYLEERKVDVNS